MSHNTLNKAQSRGLRRRLTNGNKLNLESSMDKLNSELSVAPLPDEESPVTSGDGQFGLTEVIALFVLAGSAALLNIRF